MGRNKAEKLSRYCFLRDSTKLKEVILYKISQSKKTRQAIAIEAGLSPWILSHYLNHNHYEVTTKMSQIKLLRLCGVLGIEVSLNIEITDQVI